MKLLSRLAIFALLATPALPAISCAGDTSGNSMLNGSYRFRNVMAVNYDPNTFNVSRTIASYGTIAFNGAGGYSLTGTYVDNTVNGGKAQNIPATSGCYAIGSNGTGYIANPILLSVFNYVVYDYGAVAQGVFTGSMTESGNITFSDGSRLRLPDIFIALPAGTPANSGFTSPYWTGALDFTSGIGTHTKNAMFKLAPNGSGGLGALTISGQDLSQSSGVPLTQTSTGGTYSFASDGTATLNITAPSGVSTVNALFTGTKTMYVSSDGAFVLGWSPTGYDIIFGVRALTQPADQSTFQGTYYTASMELGTQVYCGGTLADAYAGSMSADGAGNAIVHQRFWSAVCLDGAYDYTTDDYVTVNADGTIADTDYAGYRFAFGNGGSAFVGISGSSGFFSLVVGLRPSAFSGSGVYLNPLGIVNAGSFAPVTAPLVPGELITLFGTGLAPATLVSTGGLPFPTDLGGVKVTIAGTPAPIYYVSKTQISVIVPYGLASTTTGLAPVQVNNNGTLSNTVTLYASDALPGIFTQSQNGLGYGSILHPDGSTVTPKNPAQAGEVLAVYLTGLGTVSPTVTDGSPGPSNPLSISDAYAAGYPLGVFQVYFNDYSNSAFVPAKVTYAGLAPGLAGLYQMNVQVPTGVGPGDVYLEVVVGSSSDQSLVIADVNQVQVTVGGSGAAAAPAPRAVRPANGRRQPLHPGRRGSQSELSRDRQGAVTPDLTQRSAER